MLVDWRIDHQPRKCDFLRLFKKRNDSLCLEIPSNWKITDCFVIAPRLFKVWKHLFVSDDRQLSCCPVIRRQTLPNYLQNWMRFALLKEYWWARNLQPNPLNAIHFSQLSPLFAYEFTLRLVLWDFPLHPKSSFKRWKCFQHIVLTRSVSCHPIAHKFFCKLKAPNHCHLLASNAITWMAQKYLTNPFHRYLYPCPLLWHLWRSLFHAERIYCWFLH